MRAPTTRTRRLRQAFGHMPPMHHTQPGAAFAWGRSDVAAWMATHPDVPALLFDLARAAGAIGFDPIAGRWSGRYLRRPELEAVETALPPAGAAPTPGPEPEAREGTAAG